MLRRVTSRPAVAIAVAVLWTAAMVGIAMTQETPVGKVEGRVFTSEGGKPIADASVRLITKAPMESKEWKIYGVRTDENGAFNLNMIPTGDYTIEANGKAHNLSPVEVTVREGHIESFNLELTPSDPYLNLYINQPVYTTGETPQIALDGFTKGDEISVAVRRVKPEKVLSGEANRVMRMAQDPWSSSNISKDELESLEPATVTTLKITKRDSEGVYHQRMSLPVAKPGIYIISASIENQKRAGWISVSDISLITKESGSEALAYVVKPDSGEPVPGAEVKVIGANVSGITDENGLLKTPLPPKKDEYGSRMIMALKGDSVAFLNSYMYARADGPISIYAYTDRPIYRPGQDVHFRGIVRKFADDKYQLPKGGEVRVNVTDKRDTAIYSKSIKLNRFGTFKGGLKLPDYAPTGGYSISCNYSGTEEAVYFNVAEYRKPEFEVSVEMPKKHCVRGEKIKAKVKASYYFGAPVAGAQVRYSVSRSDYWFWGDDEDYGYYGEGEYEYEGDGYYDYGGYGGSTAEGVVRTGPDGTAEIEFSANWKQGKDDYGFNDQEFTVWVNVTDPSRQESSAEGSIIATQGEFKVTTDSESYVTGKGESARFNITASSYDKKPQAGIEMGVTASKISWDRGDEHYAQVASAKVKTDKDGRALFAFTPKKEGSYVIRTECKDKKGNVIRSSGWLWVSGESDEIEGYRYPSLHVILDKKSYNPGDTAKVLINSKEKGATALVTIEGRRLYDYKLVKLDGKSTVIDVPIKDEYKPNCYIGVCFVKDKKFINQGVQAKVSVKENTLKLTVTPDKNRYEPGDQAVYLIKASDHAGKPVEAEVSLGVVDESIYQLSEDNTPVIKDFFYHSQPNSVQTRYSFPEVYLSGDKAGYAGKVRKEFVDTAYWRADVVTNADGEARVSFKIPDNLTTWRATARAVTLDTAVGECTSKAICSKDMLVRLETPRFMIQKDETVISAIVHNYLKDRQRVKVTLDAPGIAVDGNKSRTVNIPSNGVTRVEWRVAASRLGNTSITAYATCPAASDAMQLTIPVRPHGQRLAESLAGSVSGGAVDERIIVRNDSVLGASDIRIRLAPSIASTMLGSLDYLAKYPYGCTEQTMSCFLPDVVIWQTLKTLNINNPELEKRLPDMVGKGLNRLYDLQNYDGGWGWCAYSSEDLWMTSYVVYGLAAARSAGFEVNSRALKNGIEAIKAKTQKTGTASDKVYALYVLSTAGQKDFVRGELTDLLKIRAMDTKNTAYMAMLLRNIGDTERANQYLAGLWSMANEDSHGIYWIDSRNSYGSNTTEATAVAMMAITQITPNDPRIAKSMRWLLGQRKLNHWNSTKDTAMILYAMSNYLARSGELEPDYTATILHNGVKAATVRFDKSTLFAPEREIVIKAKDIHAGPNDIRVEMSGAGMLYYTVQLTQYIERDEIPRTITGSGITVTRQYYKLVPRRDDRLGYSRMEPARSPTTEFRSGDIIQVRLTVNTPKYYNYLLVEDYFPAGCETSDRGRMEPWEWDYWWVDKDVRDERVSFYIENLNKGKHVIEYQFRAGIPGNYHAIPAVVESMYEPSIRASGVEDKVRIKD